MSVNLSFSNEQTYMRMFVKSLLRRILWSKRQATRKFRKSHHNWCCSPKIIRVIKSR